MSLCILKGRSLERNSTQVYWSAQSNRFGENMGTQPEETGLWKRDGRTVYLTHLSDRNTVETKFSMLVQPGVGVEDAEAEIVAKQVVELLQLVSSGDPTHVDDFIDFSRDMSEATTYARWFFLLHRLPASLKASFRKQILSYKLFCMYQGKKYRVTGASRMGDIWLTSNMEQDTGYELRVNLADCSEWLMS